MTAFVLGNGLSRSSIDVEQLITTGLVYGCNALYRTHTPTVLVATDRAIADDIQRSGYSLKHKFYTRQPLPDLGAVSLPDRYRGYSSGPNAVALAGNAGHQRVYLLGFDMGPTATGNFNNVYADTEFYKSGTAPPTYTGNWVRQLITVFNDFPSVTFVRVVGKTTAGVVEFNTVTNFESMPISEFETRINTVPKDL